MNYLKGDIILLPYPFTDLTTKKVRPAIVVGATGNKYADIFIVPLTSRIKNLEVGEFVPGKWKEAGLNVPSAVKRGCVLIDKDIIISKVGTLGVILSSHFFLIVQMIYFLYYGRAFFI